MNIRRILVTTDLSDAAQAAFSHVTFLSKKLGAQPYLLHVDETTTFGFRSPEAISRHFDAVTSTRQGRLTEFKRNFAEQNVDIEVICRDGVPWKVILETAKQVNADLIVSTKLGARGLERLLLGSTTTQVLRHADRPMLIVPSKNAASDVQYKRLIVTTDFSEASQRGLNNAVDLAGQINIPVHLTHVLRLPMLLGTIPGENIVTMPEAFQRHAAGDATEALNNAIQQCAAHTTTTIEPKLLLNYHVADAIIEEAENETDLIVIPSQGKGAWRTAFLGSTSEAILKLAKNPVLVLPGSYLETRGQL